MIAPLAKFIDWSAIQAVSLMMPTHDSDARLEEAIRFLNGPDFIPTDSQPAQVEFDGSVHFRFPTPRPCDSPENNVVHGRLYRCSEPWQERPVIILLHGWGDWASYKLRFPLIARRCNRKGFNVATLVAPAHFQRRLRQRGTFDHGDILLLAQRAAQGIAEIRAMAGWLLKEGCPAVALWGYSLGAWYAGMAVCRDARLASVVLTGPPARCNPWVEQRAVLPRVRRRLAGARELCEALNLTPMNLTLTQPAILSEKILLIEGIHDLICPKEDIEGLWRAWGQPDIWRLPHGHVNVCCGGVPGLTGRVVRWLVPRLGNRMAQSGYRSPI
jgi:pimeloyl-ACP methyl ester carboxylesterase